MNFKLVLIAVDGSASSLNACEVLASSGLIQRETQIELVGVFDIDRLGYLELLDLDDAIIQRGRERFRVERIEPAHKALEESGLYVTKLHVESGDPVHRIRLRAKESEAELLVVGRRGLGRLSYAVLGSVSESILNDLDRPVLVVPDDLNEESEKVGDADKLKSHKIRTGKLKTIVVGTDFSDEAASGVHLAASIAKSLSSRLILVHAIPRLALLPNGTTTDQNAVPTSIEQLYEDLRGDADVRMEELLSELKAQGLDVSGSICDLLPADALLNASRDHHAQLMVIASHGRSGFQRFWLGGVAQQCLRRSTIPVLVTPVQVDESKSD